MKNDSFKNKELVLSCRQVRNCDKIAIEQFGIDGRVLMENAGAAAAQRVMAHLKSISGQKVLITAGCGNNGGDGFVVARHLFNNRYPVEVLICSSRDRIKGDALNNLKIIELMKIPIKFLGQPGPQKAAEVNKRVAEVIARQGGKVDLIVDALLGTGIAGPPREPIRTAIVTINQLGKKVVALDIPSGLDCDSGKPLTDKTLGESAEETTEVIKEEDQVGLAIRADETVTFAAMKKGFLHIQAQKFTGDITVASIGIDISLLLKQL